MPVPVLELADDAGEGVDRVRRDAPERARMEIDRGALRVQFEVEETAQRGGKRRVVLLVEAAVPNQDGVSLELRAVRVQVAGEGFAGDLLLAFEQEAQVDRRPTRGDEVLDRLQRRHVVALVVRAASGVDAPGADFRLER